VDEQTTELLGLLAVVLGLSVGYGKAFGAYQTYVTQAVIDSVGVRSRYRAAVNIGVGLVLAVAFSTLGAWRLGDWSLLAAGGFAGFLASVEAGKVHDEKDAEEKAAKDLADQGWRR
jgi:hypothetical protein